MLACHAFKYLVGVIGDQFWRVAYHYFFAFQRTNEGWYTLRVAQLKKALGSTHPYA